MPRIVCALLACAAVLALPVRAEAGWTRLATDQFLFIGDAPEPQMRGIAGRLEQFRGTLGRLFGGDTIGTPLPTVVVVFQNATSFAPFTPRYHGRPIGVGGYFIGTEDTNYIAVNAEQEAAAYGVILHEYTHFLVRSAVGEVPVWAGEGLAEFYQTFAPRDGDQGAVIGMPSADNLALLTSTPLLSIPDLIAVTHDSPLYNEGSRRSVFYAQSWALVHYLTLGSRERAGQLQEYLAAFRQGAPTAEAFRQAFGSDTAALEQELHTYIRRLQFSAIRVRADETLAAARRWSGERIADSEAAGYLGDLMGSIGRVDEAREYLRQALEQDATAARAAAALSVLEYRAQRHDTALALAERAAALAPGLASAHRIHGRLLARIASRGGADEQALYRRARTALSRALALEPDHTATAIALAGVELSLDDGAGNAAAILRRVVAAAPGRDDLRLTLAQALVADGDFASAAALLEPIAARPSRPEIGREAGRMLSYIAAVTGAPR